MGWGRRGWHAGSRHHSARATSWWHGSYRKQTMPNATNATTYTDELRERLEELGAARSLAEERLYREITHQFLRADKSRKEIADFAKRGGYSSLNEEIVREADGTADGVLYAIKVLRSVG